MVADIAHKLIFEKTTDAITVGEFELPGSRITITRTDDTLKSFMISENCDGEVKVISLSPEAIRAMARDLSRRYT